MTDYQADITRILAERDAVSQQVTDEKQQVLAEFCTAFTDLTGFLRSVQGVRGDRVDYVERNPVGFPWFGLLWDKPPTGGLPIGTVVVEIRAVASPVTGPAFTLSGTLRSSKTGKHLLDYPPLAAVGFGSNAQEQPVIARTPENVQFVTNVLVEFLSDHGHITLP